jgi:lipopolysaccharide/colanic/teichoic acid biosynthesis glycosyltransferase
MHRFLDIFLSAIALLFMLPFMLPIVFILRATGEGEVFYSQSRVGRGGKNFRLYKFATMLKDSPKLGNGEVTVLNDPRVLPFGKFLRKSKINELPQLWNIFIGDMSVVGPRPMVPSTFRKYPAPAQLVLNTVRPGLTGLGSIIFRDEEKLLDNLDDPTGFYDLHIAPYKSNLEVWYVKQNTIWLYLKIILVTAWVVVAPASKIADRSFPGMPEVPDRLK